jgi:hypothetical protein
MTGPDDFFAGLRELGLEPERREAGGLLFAVFPYTVPVGSRLGEEIQLGLDAPQDWPETPPHGPHVSPPFDHPQGANHPSVLGDEWRHWSRPPANWGATTKSVQLYMRHLGTLFSQI